ncbi:MAG: ribonuclease HII [Candidatus Stahlbacteria bacterium]|nr:ribonuclease HII [Candidatus Stahlbacteria bacterium]
MSLVLGIDEAGRGPVIGPLVICGALCDEREVNQLKDIGVKDSKCLTKLQRESLVPRIKSIIKDFAIIQIPPAMLDRENINSLEIQAAAELINKFSPTTVIIDTPVQSKGSLLYCNRIRELIHHTNVHIIGEPHADTNYTICGAASILAKVVRDKEIEELHKKYGDFGSGYPADPKTAQFIKEWNKFAEIVRRKWDTCRDVIVAHGRVIVIGEMGTGKTEFCKWLVNAGLEKGYKVGVIDLDISQSNIGPPGSLGFGVTINPNSIVLLEHQAELTALVPHINLCAGEQTKWCNHQNKVWRFPVEVKLHLQKQTK